jgi:hypothetical protein
LLKCTQTARADGYNYALPNRNSARLAAAGLLAAMAGSTAGAFAQTGAPAFDTASIKLNSSSSPRHVCCRSGF